MNFTLTTLPPSPNKRVHWAVKRKMRDEYAWLMIQAMGVPRLKVLGKARVDIVRYAIRMMDKDNLYASMKQVIDALRMAHIIVDDTEEHITLTVTQERVHAKKDQRVEITVEEL